MNYCRITRSLFAASMLLAAAAVNAEIVSCITDTGMATVTDAPCKNDEETVYEIGQGKKLPADLTVAPTVKGIAEAERVRATRAAMQKNASGRSVSADTVMMKVAHAMMTSNDEPFNRARKQALSDSARARSASYWGWLVPQSEFSVLVQ